MTVPQTAIYFAACNGRIKIGVSKDIERRLHDISLTNPFPITIIASVVGDRPFEAAIHKRLRQHRVRGEWFDDCEAVREAIADILARGREAVADWLPRSAVPYTAPYRSLARPPTEARQDPWLAQTARLKKLDDAALLFNHVPSMRVVRGAYLEFLPLMEQSLEAPGLGAGDFLQKAAAVVDRAEYEIAGRSDRS